MQGHARDRHQRELAWNCIRCSAFRGCSGQCDLLNEGSLCPPSPNSPGAEKTLNLANVTAARKRVEDAKANQLTGPLDAIMRDNGMVP